MERLRKNGKTQKHCEPQLESGRMERHRMESLRKTLSPNWNHVEWKDIEWKDSEILKAPTGIT
jgi:hypothetical protein